MQNQNKPNNDFPFKRILLRYDEFFKTSCVDFFTKYGFLVETELEIYKLPKRLDVLAINTNTTIPENFTLLRYWNQHNLISYKSKNDNFRKKDILDASIYLLGYINNTPHAEFENTSISIFMNHRIPKYFQKFQDHTKLIEPGVWEFDFSFYKIHLINLREIKLSGLDRKFLANFSTDEKFYELIGLTEKERKEIDEVLPYIKMRATDPTIPKNIKESIMKNQAVLDITELARPVYEKGRLEGKIEGKSEGKLEDARLMKAKGLELSLILEITGFTKDQLKEHGIL